MKVHELLETNPFVGDLEIDIRGDSGVAVPGYSNTLSHMKRQWRLGINAGVKGPYPKDYQIYLPEPINAIDAGGEYCKVLINKIPNELLNLNVVEWYTRSRPEIGKNALASDRCQLYVWAWTDETLAEYEQQDQLKKLERAEKRAKMQQAEEKQLEGQTSLFDFGEENSK